MSFVYVITPELFSKRAEEPKEKVEKIEKEKVEIESKKDTVPPKRCFQCKKKLGILGICNMACECSNYYCHSCKQAERHNCTFDYKAKEKKKLEQANTKVTSSQFEKL